MLLAGTWRGGCVKQGLFVPSGFPALQRVALMFVHPMKSCGTSVRFAMHKLNGDGWTHVGRKFCFRGADDLERLRAPGFLDAHPRLYFEFHCNPYEALDPQGALWEARAYLRERGWTVVTATMLRDPVSLVPSYYGHFGPGHPRRGLDAKLNASLAQFVRCHFDFALCTIWGMASACERPLHAAEGGRRRPSGAGLEATRQQALGAGGRGPRAGAAGMAFAAFEAAAREEGPRLTQGCGRRAARGGAARSGAIALQEAQYHHCEPAPYRALVHVQTAWAAFQAAARAADPSLCARQLRPLDERLGRLDVVGVCERWDESFLLLARQLGLQRFPRVKVNVRGAPPEPGSERHALGTRLAVSEGCGASLYQKWARAFDARVAQAGAEFNATLTQLRGASQGEAAAHLVRRRPQSQDHAASAVDMASPRYRHL